MSQIVYQTTAAERHDTIPVLLRKLSQKLGVPVLQGDSVYNTMFRILRDQSWTLGSAVNYVNVAAHRRQFSVIPARHDTLPVLFYKFGMRTGFVIEGNDFLRREVIKQALAAAGTTPTPEPEPEPEPLDPDVVSFVTRAGLTEETHISAVSDLVETLKLSGVWGQSLVLYPFVGGTALAHSQNLKSSDFPITWIDTVLHDANGARSDGLTGYGQTGFICNDEIPSINSAFVHVYCAESALAGTYAIGVQGQRVGLQPNPDPPNPAAVSGIFHTTFHSNACLFDGGNLLINRTASNLEVLYSDTANSVNLTVPVSGMPTLQLYVLTTNNAGAPGLGSYLTVPLQFSAIGNGLSEPQRLAFMTAVDDFQTALGRAV